MAFLVDTVTLSELRKKAKANSHVLAWQAAFPGLHYLSVITMNEIQFGIRRIERKDKDFAERLKCWYQEILRASDLFAILPVDLAIAESGADMRYDYQMGYDDSLIAATARIHGLTVATRDVTDFEKAGVTVLNPWEFEIKICTEHVRISE